MVIPAGRSAVLTSFPVIVANNGQRGPSIAYDYGNGQYYLSWNDRRSGANYDVYGARVATTGVSLDGTGVLLSSATGNQFRPTVTDRRSASDINNHLVAWTSYGQGQTGGGIYGIYVDNTGTPVGSEFAISTTVTEDKANVVADVDWISSKQSLVGNINMNLLRSTIYPFNYLYPYYQIKATLVGQSGVSPYHVAMDSHAADQRAEVIKYTTDGVADYGFLAVWMDKRNGTDYDIYSIKVWS